VRNIPTAWKRMTPPAWGRAVFSAARRANAQARQRLRKPCVWIPSMRRRTRGWVRPTTLSGPYAGVLDPQTLERALALAQQARRPGRLPASSYSLLGQSMRKAAV